MFSQCLCWSQLVLISVLSVAAWWHCTKNIGLFLGLKITIEVRMSQIFLSTHKKKLKLCLHKQYILDLVKSDAKYNLEVSFLQ